MVKCLNPNVDDLCLHWQVVRCQNPHVADCCHVNSNNTDRLWNAWTLMSMTIVVLTLTLAGGEMPEPSCQWLLSCWHWQVLNCLIWTLMLMTAVVLTLTGDEMPELSCRWLLCFQGQVVRCLNPHVADCCHVDTDRWWDAFTHMLMIGDCCVDSDRWWDAWTIMLVTVAMITLTGGEMPEPTCQWLLSCWHLQVWNAWNLMLMTVVMLTLTGGEMPEPWCWWLLSCWH